MTTVLITGARAPVAQDLARAFRAAGCEVHLADSVRPWAAGMIRPRLPIHRLPPPRSSFAAFRTRLRALVDETGATLVVPTCEEVFWVSEAAARDGYADRVFTPSLAILRRLHSKAEFPALVAELGLPAPETRVLDTAEALAALGWAPETLVLKPEFSRFGSQVRIAPDAAALARIRPTPQRRWVAQRRIVGEEVCAWAAVRDGAVVAFAAYRPRWRQGAAAAFQFEAVNLPQVRRVAEAVASATNMTGHLSFDLIVDDAGRAWPIECNPRAVSGLHLFDADPGLARAILGQGACTPPPAGRLRHLAPAMWLLGLPAAVGSGELAAWQADRRQSRDVIARPGNRAVWAGCLIDAARFALVAARSGRSAAAATTADIEWDGEAMP